MENKEFLKQLKKERATYKEMVEFCCDSMVLNNYIIQELSKKDYYFELFCGNEREFYNEHGEEISEEEYYNNEEQGEEIYKDIYQYFIINYQDAERLAEYTDEIVFYNEDLDLYLLGVTHWGTSWAGVPANWKA